MCTLLLTVLGTSMSPAIPNGSRVEAAPAPCVQTYTRNDVVFFHSGAEKIPILKRIVAMPGDTFALASGTLLVNGTPATTLSGQAYSLGKNPLITYYAESFHNRIPANTYLVLGENPHGTTDSTRFGLINAADLLGKLTSPTFPPR